MKRRISIYMLLIAAIALSSGCRPPRGSPAFQPAASQRIYKMPFDRVWDASLAVVTEDLKMPLDVVERSTGVITTEWLTYERRPGDYTDAQHITEANKPNPPLFMSYRLMILVKITDEGTMVRVRRNQKQWYETWTVVPTDLQFERQVLILVDKRLGVNTQQ